jgi:hypothetical protein
MVHRKGSREKDKRKFVRKSRSEKALRRCKKIMEGDKVNKIKKGNSEKDPVGVAVDLFCSVIKRLSVDCCRYPEPMTLGHNRRALEGRP